MFSGENVSAAFISKMPMPTNTLIEVEQSWSRRADPDPIISIGEAYDANRVYQYTWLRIGTCKIKMKNRERARRTLKHLLDALNEALVTMPARGPSAEGDEPYIPPDEES